jgi:hypothetical protein
VDHKRVLAVAFTPEGERLAGMIGPV